MKFRQLLRTTYWAGFLFSLHVALTVYINSSFLASKVPESLIGMLYTASAVLAVIGLFLVPKLINQFGTARILGTILILNIVNLIGMVAGTNVAIVAGCFVMYFAFNTLIYLGIDILIEHWSSNSVQGAVRGSYLTAMNIGFMLAPLIGGFITDRLGFGALYVFAILLSIPVAIMIGLQLPSIKNTHASKANILALARRFIQHPNLGRVFVVNFLLQFFYAWMVIYTPLYLHEQAGLPWDTIGVTFTLMLSAFVIFQYITGKIADRFHCEKWMMILGLLVMGVATLFLATAGSLGFWTLVLVLFITRIGASIVEVMTESYFFKHVHHDDTGSIGFFRNTYPFAYILAPLVASVVLGFAPMWSLFTVLGILCCAGVFVAIKIKAHG